MDAAPLDARLGLDLRRVLDRLLPQIPDPELALSGLDRFAAAASLPVLDALRRDPSLLQALLTLLSHSQFLAEALIQSPRLLLWLDDARRESHGRDREAWTAALADFVSGAPPAARSALLARFKRREYLRIVWRDLLGLAGLAETTQELSHLADAMLHQAYVWGWNDLAGQFGPPLEAPAPAIAEMTVLALGKLGGEELNYSSDIDLMFLYSAEGETVGAAPTSNREFFTRLAQSIIQTVSAAAAGGAYRVDLRLRPGGREGDLALSFAQGIEYYQRNARDWEAQMLIRARPCAGSIPLGQRFLAALRPRIYPLGVSPAEVAAAVRLSRLRIAAHLDHRRALRRLPAPLDVKLDAGGIRDIEFLVQYLQRAYGGAEAWLRSGNTLIALQRLHDKGHLGGAEFQLLSSVYSLLRQIEHRLQLHLGQQTHSLPADPLRLTALARSLLLTEGGRRSAISLASPPPEAAEDDAGRLLAAVAEQMAAIRGLYERHVGADEMTPATPHSPDPDHRSPQSTPEAPAGAAPGPLETAWARRWQGLPPLGRHADRQLRRLLQSAATVADSEREFNRLPAAALPRLGRALAASDAMAESLIRRPSLVQCLLPRGLVAPPKFDPLAAPSHPARMRQLRIWRQQQGFRILLAEMETTPRVARTLHLLTALAEQTLAWALALARADLGDHATPLAVLGLGRLGLGELDLFSDLDLVFVARDSPSEPATRLAAKLIEVLTAYTQEGALYTVDTRLRPGGGEGELVQSPAALAAHFERRADAWEALSYLKARVVAGDAPLGEEALLAVCRQLPARFADPAALRPQMLALRQRIEIEGHPGQWGLKTPAGGYFDIDFIVSSRMLSGEAGAPHGPGLAGMARALAPRSLSHAAARQLAQDADLLRAADHALRAATGHAGADVPASGDPIERAHTWLRRVWPHPLAGSLEELVAAARARIRSVYAALLPEPHAD